MKIFKAWYHFKAFVKKMIYKVVYGNKIHIGRGTTWRNGFHISIEGGNVEIGRKCFFNHNCSINSLNKIVIGQGTIFGENCHIYDHNHRFRDDNESIKSQGYKTEKTQIGNHCWIGSNVIVLKGVSVGDNSVIGAGCVIEKDIPANSIVHSKDNIIVQSKE